nr:reverse transcriptase domain-containing protein [Tanacetum cinerariifolium]
MRTRSSSNLPGESSPNSSFSNLKRRNRGRSKQPFIPEESLVDTMADQRTMAKLLHAPTEGYAKAIVDNPRDHIRWGTPWWLKKEPPRSILTWEDLISKFINAFFPPSRTTNLRNEIPNFQQRFDESFHEACDRYKYLLRACPHHGFTELHQLDTFYNALNPANQDSLNSVTGGNLLERRTQDVLTIIENKSKIAKLTHAVNQQTSDVTTAMTAILKQFQATPPLASVKAVQEICVTCGGAHPYYQCLAVDGNTFLELRDNIQGYVSAAVVNYNQGNSGYRPPVVPLSELEKIKRMNEANMKAMQTQINNLKNKLRNEMKNSIQASISNQTNELKNTMASFFQMNTASTSGSRPLPSNTIANPKDELKSITTRSGIVLDGPSVHIPPPFINPEADEREEETLTDQDLAAYTIKEMLGLPELISIRMTLELANQAICTPAGIARDVFVPIDKFTFPVDFVIVDYENDPRVPLILGRPFLRTARALIDVHRERMILHLFATNHQSGKPTFSSHTDLTLPEVKDDIFDPEGGNVLIEKAINLDSTKDIPPPHNVNPSGASTTSFFPNHLLEEFADELALITFSPGNDDLPFDIESNLKEIEYFLNHDPIKEMDSILKDSVDENNLADLNDNLVDTIPEMFTEEHALDYSFPPLYDEYDDDIFEVESDIEYVYDDPFDSKVEKIKDSKLLIDELDLPRSSDFLHSPEYDSFLFEDFFEVDALPSTDNEDKVFNPAVILKKLPEKLRDPGKFLLLCGFSELKCKALADLGASINLMPLYVWKKLGLPELISTRITLELANRAICTPVRIARDVFMPVGKFTFPADYVIVDYESDPKVPLILGRPFLQTARALINVHGEEMILHDGDEILTLNMRHDTSRYSN